MKTLTMNTNGGAVFWKAGDSIRSRFASLGRLGLDAFIPPQRSEEALLRDALCQIFRDPTTLVRSLGEDGGFTVIDELRGKTRNQYQTRCSAKWADGKLEVDSPNPGALLLDIEAKIREGSDQVAAIAVTQSLVKLITHLGGIPLRPSGAVYWLLNDRLDQWADAAAIYSAAAAEAGATSIYVMKTVADPGAIDAVCDALTTDTAKQIEALNAEILSGELGPIALKNRAEDLEALRSRMASYESSLGKGLEGLAKMIDEASTATATAILAASARADSLRADRDKRKGAKP